MIIINIKILVNQDYKVVASMFFFVSAINKTHLPSL